MWYGIDFKGDYCRRTFYVGESKWGISKDFGEKEPFSGAKGKGQLYSAINSLGTVVIAASSAAFNIEILVYYVFNSFSQACTTFVGQNYGAGQIKRCRKTLFLCLIEDAAASILSILLILSGGKFLLSLFNSDAQVIELGYTRLLIIFTAYIFSMIYQKV